MYNLFENITENEKNELLKILNSFAYKFNKNEIIPKDIFFKKSIGIQKTQIRMGRLLQPKEII